MDVSLRRSPIEGCLHALLASFTLVSGLGGSDIAVLQCLGDRLALHLDLLGRHLVLEPPLLGLAVPLRGAGSVRHCSGLDWDGESGVHESSPRDGHPWAVELLTAPRVGGHRATAPTLKRTN